MRRLGIAAVLLVLAGCGGGPADELDVVASVRDGDTVLLEDGRRVRLVQVDAPELGTGECYGRDAFAELERLLPRGARVVLEADPALDDVDRFGRLLRYVVHGGTNVNLELVRRGAAEPFFFRGDRGRHARALLEAAAEARAAGRGLWGACGP